MTLPCLQLAQHATIRDMSQGDPAVQHVAQAEVIRELQLVA